MSRRPPALKSAAASDRGLVREGNEDLFICNERDGIYAVIDGVGGEEGGEEAARIAASTVQSRLSHPSATVEQRLREAITLANNEIYKMARATPARSRMACVLTVAVVDGERLVIGHVGDSRLYLLGRGEIRQITTDHSPVGEMERRGTLSEIEAMRHPRRSEIFRDVGSDEHHFEDEGFVEILSLPLPPDGAFLLCSDGLSDQVPQAEVRRLVEEHAGDPEAAVEKLVAAANLAGGKDNVTVVLVESESFGRPLAAKPVPSKTQGAGHVPSGWSRGLASARLDRLVRVLAVALGLLLVAYLGSRLPALLSSGPEPSPAAAAALAKVWSVGPGKEASTISAALARASAGDTILVEPGVYREAIALKTGVRVVSRASRQAVLRPAAGSGIAVRAVAVHGAVLEGFAISGEEAQALEVGIELRDASVELVDLEIIGAKTIGLDIQGLGASIIRGCALRGNAGGAVRVASVATQSFERNWFRQNGSATVPVIFVGENAFPRFDGNDFADNPGLPIRGLDPRAMAETFERNRFGNLPAQRAIQPRSAP